MPVDVEDLLKLLGTLSDEANLRVNVKESVKGGLIAGLSTAIGGVLLGPPGLAIGGAFGGCTAAYMANGKFKPLSQILWEMEPDKKRELYDNARIIVNKLHYTDVVMLAALINADVLIKKELIDVVIKYVSGAMKMEILD
ncbi:protein C19orf12-like [Tubulanus polymorphus]|uniref:protein C19orf12-like n=1 Tax=Tubulanus polymorphus TaxID=672921 RepID=UPI003DA5392F